MWWIDEYISLDILKLAGLDTAAQVIFVCLIPEPREVPQTPSELAFSKQHPPLKPHASPVVVPILHSFISHSLSVHQVHSKLDSQRQALLPDIPVTVALQP